ncbi:MAG: archease [Thermoplasmatales archaeon]|jgi:SHS2 domain-containing protein|nr:archease [Thermoplasmatales archaeon]
MIRIIEHTADIGIEVEGKNLEDAFSEAAIGLTSLMVYFEKILCIERREIRIESSDIESLLVKFLSEILYLFDAESMVFSSFEVKIEGNSLKAILCGERYSREKHGSKLNVKAVTYHMLQVDPSGKVRVIFDI